MKLDVVASIDPGGDTGIVAVWRWGTFESSTFDSRGSVRKYLQRIEQDYGKPTIICEDWTAEKGARTDQRDAWLLIGWLDGWADDLFLQQRGDRMWTTTGKLKAAGLKGITNDHQKQAARHLVRWAMVNPAAAEYAAVADIRTNVTAYLRSVSGND